MVELVSSIKPGVSLHHKPESVTNVTAENN